MTKHAIFECQRVQQLWVDSGVSELAAHKREGLCELVVSWRDFEVEKWIMVAVLVWVL